MGNLALVVHTSLDGFVAGINGELDAFPRNDENLGFVCGLTDQADTALFGRLSFELLDSYWPTAKDLPNNTKNEIGFSNWYNNASKIVFSKTLTKSNRADLTIFKDNIGGNVDALKKKSGKDILIFGSPSIARPLIEMELIDRIWIFINPLIFGKGIPLFLESKTLTKLKLMGSKQFVNGELAINYLVEKKK